MHVRFFYYLLLAVCLTLWQQQRYVYMKLDYYDTCPDEYEPPGFGPMDNVHAVHFSRKPFHMCGMFLCMLLHVLHCMLMSHEDFRKQHVLCII